MPILIVFTISLTGQVISFALKNVQVERIEIKDIYNNLLNLSQTFNLELSENGMEIRIETYPNIATDHTLEAKIASGEGEVLFEQVEGKLYKITPQKGGEVVLIVSSVNNVNAFAKINIYVSSKKLGFLNVFTETGHYIQQDEVFNLEKETNLYLEAYPLESIYDKDITYKSSDTNIATVDKNGRLTPIANGTCQLEMSITDNTDTKYKRTIDISTEKAIVQKNKFYSSRNLTIAEVKNLLLVNKSAEVVDLGNNNFDVKYDDKIIRLQGEIISANEWEISREIENVFMHQGGVFLKAENLDILNQKQVFPKFTSSNNNIAEVTEDQLILKNIGIIKLTAELDGKIIEKEIVVNKRALTYQLNYTQEDNNKGIKGERVWAINSFSNFELKTTTRTIDLKINPNSILPRDATMEVEYTLSDTSVAQIDKNGMVELFDTAIGKTIVVTARYKYKGILTSTFKSYEIKVIDDIRAYNVYNAEEARYVFNRGQENSPIALQNDIVTPTEGDGNWAFLEGCSNIYGNGFNVFNNIKYTVFLHAPVYSATTTMTIDNLFIYNRTADEYKKAPAGDVLNAQGVDKEPEEEGFLETRRVFVTNCYLAFGANGFNSVNSIRLTIESTIFSNIQALALVMMLYEPAGSEYVLDKVVVKDSEAFTFGSMLNIASTNMHKGFPPVIFKNFVDSYSWCQRSGLANVIKMLDLAFLDTILPGLGDSVAEEVVNILDAVFKNPQYDNMKLSYKAKGDKETKDYYHMGGVMMGFYANADEKLFIDETKDYMNIPFALNPKQVVSILNLEVRVTDLEKMIEKAMNKKLKLTETNQLISYNFRDNKPKFYPDSICPTNEALFIKLRNKPSK